MLKLEFRDKLLEELKKFRKKKFTLIISEDLEQFIPDLIVLTDKEIENVIIDDEFESGTFKLE